MPLYPAEAIETYSVRKITQTLARGRVVNTFESYTLRAIIDPVKELDQVKQIFGDFIDGAIRVYYNKNTLTLEGMPNADLSIGDLIIFNASNYEVKSINDYARVLPHVECTAVRNISE